jgi:uncharacterized protein (DUF983 family)
VKNPASSEASRLSPEILAALPEWVDPEDAAEWTRSHLEAVASKRCPLCGEHKLRTAFHRMRSMYDGRYPRCKECRRNERLRKLDRLPPNP